MSHLVACPGCQRHVRTTERSCPFCRTELDLAATPPPRLPTRRLGRAALFAFGATLTTSIPVASCGGDGDGGAGGTGGGGGFGNAQPAYGVPAGGTSNDDSGTAGATSSGGDAGMSGALYGSSP